MNCDRVTLLEDRLAILALIVDDCMQHSAIGDDVPAEVWRQLLLISVCADHGLSPWRQLPGYKRARARIRAAVTDMLDQLAQDSGERHDAA